MKNGILFLFLLILVMTAGAQVKKPVDAESKISFVIRNMGADVNGTLSGLKGDIKIDAGNSRNSSFDVTADVNTMNTENERRDKHLKNADFFDSEKYPVIRIRSTRILPKSGNISYAEAQLTMHGVTKDIKFDFVTTPVPGGYKLTANLNIDRLDYGVGKKSMTLGDKVSVNLSVVAK